MERLRLGPVRHVGARPAPVEEGDGGMNTEAPLEQTRGGGFAIAFSIYLVAFVTGAIVMSFEMLGSRYLAPSFGAGIYTWASLISTVLAALCVGYFLGGYVADRFPSPTVLGYGIHTS
jgi:hypothetical protein